MKLTLLVVLIAPVFQLSAVGEPCDRSRRVLTQPWGTISDGGPRSNYTTDSHCQWLIKAATKEQFITLKFNSLVTECSYDYVYVYDGDSFDSRLLGSFSGKTVPEKIVATSGFMLVLLYSDTNYVLDGFEAEYSITDCQSNCSGHGVCAAHRCICDGGWGGVDCSQPLCPKGCSKEIGGGYCDQGRCVCYPGFSGLTCSLKAKDPLGNKWHSLYYDGLRPRAAHSAVYLEAFDSLYVFGGYDLNFVLDDLVIFRFNSSQWEDDHGNVLGAISMPANHLDSRVLNAVLGKVRTEDENWGVRRKTFLHHALYSVDVNRTLALALAHSHYNDNDKRHYSRIMRQAANMDESNDGSEYEGTTMARPSARYSHSAAAFKDGFALFGGRLEKGVASDELWYYNATSNRWSLRAVTSVIRPPALARHTLTAVKDWLYLFGGGGSDGGFSHFMYRIKLVPGGGDEEQWEIVRPRGGKAFDVRLVGHTTVYSPVYDSLIVYGGLKPVNSRTSKLSDSLYMFSLSSLSWARIKYPKAPHRDQFTPLERAFHSTTLVGNYLVVFGGYTHRHKKDEICYDNQLYLYHLGCHVWVSHEILGQSDSGDSYPKKQGVFSHSAALRNGNTLLFIGGYHGNVNADLLAYTLPPTIAGKEGDVYESESMCARHHGLSECTLDPECGWCSADETCYGRTLGVNCTTNLQTTRCPGLCPTLLNCQSCLLQVPAVPLSHSQSVAHKLDLYKCSWCVQNGRCHPVNDNFGTCGSREDAPSQMAGWWGEKGVEITDAKECKTADKKPGLTFTKYYHPANYSQPDFVGVVNSTQHSAIEYNRGIYGGSVSETAPKRDYAAAWLRGFIHSPQQWASGLPEYLSMCMACSSVTLSFAYNDSSLEMVGNTSTEAFQCKNAHWQNGEAVLLPPGRHRVDFKATRLESKRDDTTSSIQLLHKTHEPALSHNKSLESKAFTFEYLEPYEGIEPCHSHSNCLACLADSKCGWCSLKSKCFERIVNDTEECRVSDEWEYFNLEPELCLNCSNLITCDSCVGSGLCEWRVGPDYAKCFRIGRSSSAIRNVDECPVPCHLRGNCSRCLDGQGGCVWCHSTQECFSFSVYTSQYAFGLCREWSEQKVEPELNTVPRACQSCSMHTNCSTCLRHLGCGWCYDVDNPITGACVPGDFSHPNIKDSCSADVNRLHNTTLYEDEAAWSYAQCPDVDECGLGLHDCHPDAKCTNTHGSYNCQCKRGFIGDGKTSCKKTCYNKCIHGSCSNEPDYVCRCDLGWTGVDCSVNCECNNHSTCSKGIGKCDECLNWTTGEFCQFCKPGSYGNATSREGCKRCNCNDHGDKEQGVCDSVTGICKCQDNTEGLTCDKCKKGFYGDPRRGGTCYYQCMSRGMVTSMKPQGLGSRLAEMSVWEQRLGPPPTRECLWIVSPTNLTQSQTPSIIQLEIDWDIDVGCTENSVYVYDGLPKFVSSSGNHQSHVLGVFCTQDTQYPVTVQAKSGVMTVHFKTEGDSKGGFNATVSVLSCPDYCPPERVCIKGSCVCPEGTTGYDCHDILCPNNCSSHLNRGSCDKGYGRCICIDGWGGANCSTPLDPDHQIVFTELFNSAHLSDQYEHLRKMLPRFGHSLLADRRSSLWLFGGYSLSHGPLNDIRLFDTKNNTWVQVTIDSTNDANMPRGRYFHAAEISLARREIFVHGGLTAVAAGGGDPAVGGGEQVMRQNTTLNDFWKFSLKNSHWIGIETSPSPPGLAGHTLTLRRDEDAETLILIGGFSTENGFLKTVWEFNPVTDQWSELETHGYGPIGVYGHSTVYHEPSKSFYVFGGYVYGVNRTHISNRLFAFHYPTKTWSALPTFSQHNPPSKNVPRARFLHSAVTTNDYMLVFGGRTESGAGPDTLVAYVYNCNYWIRLLNNGLMIPTVVGSPPPATYAHAMTLDVESSSGGYVVSYVMGGFTGSTNSHVTRIALPEDLCSLKISKDKCRQWLGCSYCSVSNNGITNSSYCYSAVKKLHVDPCQTHNGTLRTSNGQMCDSLWMAARACEAFTTCADCLARWPSQWDSNQVCKWCSKCGGSGQCIGASRECKKDTNTVCREVQSVDQCPEMSCRASDCEKCSAMGDCAWTRQVMKTSEEGGVKIAADPVYDWTCVERGLSERSSYKIRTEPACPRRCSHHMDCQSCLQSQGGEGDWHECRWSTRLGECISPSYQSLVCAGGVCGLVLSRGSHCPQPCNTFTQCSDCLGHAHCGWCAIQSENSTGQGVCTEGSLDQPSSGPEGGTCDSLFARTNTSIPELSTLSWHYVICPPENECINGHHNCDNVSETCVDLPKSYHCVCGPGYKQGDSSQGGDCVPVCSQGCVRGRCTAPDTCTCDFGYVGANCSIQCQCNGHSHCAGPDRLDECLECRNNTQGPTCNRCKPLFVGDPTDNGECIPCSDYCNNHTDICVHESFVDLNFIHEAPREELEKILGEGPMTKAKCIGCKSNTTGAKCEDCLEGHFRGSDDHRVSCRPCECHGHGHTCNPVSGEGCDCHNNTESDPNCMGKVHCWELQCSRCKESYFGVPTGGHQCFKSMTYDLRFNLGGRQLEETHTPLYPGQGAFFVVQPRFLNVDIRITIDVTQGNLEFYLSPREDTFVVELNRSSWAHEIKLDSRYYDNGEYITEVFPDDGYITNHHAQSQFHDEIIRVDRKIEKTVGGLTDYLSVYRYSHLLVVRNITNRLVVTLPSDRHDFSRTKFFIILLAVQKPAYGTIYFRQDQLHIDLFVFFSVFFSCFFLFLAACVVAWKAKQATDMRRARRRHVVEMLHMAKRPFAGVSVLVDPPPGCEIPIRPVAIEPTFDNAAAVGTLFIRLPGGASAPTRLALASALVTVRNTNHRAFLRRRSDHS